MRPAFTDVRSAAAFAFLVLALIGAPALVAPTGILDRSEVYPTLPTGQGPAAHIQRQIFAETSDLDVVFIGSSLMWSAIDAPYFQAALGEELGRDAKVTVIASVWPGLDRDYALLRDLLERRRVGLVVIQFPNRDRPTRDAAAEVNRVSDQPHVQSYRFYRVGEFPDIGDGLAARARAALYAEAVLGMPRHLLSKLRPNLMSESPVEATLGARLQPLGFFGEPYVEFRPDPPAIAAGGMIYSNATAATWEFFDEPLPEYQAHFAGLIAELLAEYDVPAVALHIPQENELDADTVEERVDWVGATGIDATMVGVPPVRLFAGLTLQEKQWLFSSDHLNDNGAIYFTRVVAPALIQEFIRHEAAD